MDTGGPIGNTDVDCGCDELQKRKRAALEKGRAARRAKRYGEDQFKGLVRNLACLCRDSFGRVYPCPCEPSPPASSPPESPASPLSGP